MLKQKYFILLIIQNLRCSIGYDSFEDSSGEWTNWSDWSSCIGECSYGYKFRSRICEKKPGNTEKQCIGLSKMQKICQIKKKCVVNGGWGDWSSFKCNTKCALGVQIRRRTCDNPPPSNNGSDCLGFPEEAGICSDFSRDDCLKDSDPLKFMPFYLKYLILNKLKSKAENYIENSRGYFICDENLLKKIKKSFEDVKIEWMFNENVVKTDNSYFEVGSSDNFTGIFMCTVKIPIFKYRIVLNFFPWIVENKKSEYKGQPVYILANVMILHSILRHLNLKINVVKNLKITDSFKISDLSFDNHLRSNDHYLVEKADNDSYAFYLTDYNNPPRINICTNRVYFEVKNLNLNEALIDEDIFWFISIFIIGTYLLFSISIFVSDLKEIKKMSKK